MTYKYNQEFFKTPNLLNCYWAGFLAADGYIFDRNKFGGKRFGIFLQEKDLSHIQRFVKDIEFNGKISERKRAHQKYPDRLFTQYGIQFSISQWEEDLRNNFNITQRKSLTLIPPNLTDEELIKAFIIGYIDGDGSISEEKTGNRESISIVGTKSFLLWIKLYFDTICASDFYAKCANVNKKTDSRTYCYAVGRNRAISIYLQLKDLQVPKLERKWNKNWSIREVNRRKWEGRYKHV